MKRDNLPWRALQPASLAWNPAPVSTTFDDVYFSQDNGPAESVHVFLEGNGLPERWQSHSRPHFCIGETGFGTGLNFLLTWRAWRQSPGPVPDLHYLSIEKHPLSRDDLARALALWPDLGEFAEQLLRAYPAPLAGQHRVVLDEGRVRLDLWWEDATEALTDLASRDSGLVDAWYLDGFAPDRNKSMWANGLLRAAAALSRPGATFATFTAAGWVRRNLQDAGFRVEKVPGYGRKRECLRGTLKDQGTVAVEATPDLQWDIAAGNAVQPTTALVLGSGLAGCNIAAALARRGIAVTVLEQGAVAGAGSAIDQGIIYTRLSRKHSALADFSLLSFQFAVNFYRELFATGRLTLQQDGELCGSFQQSDNARDLADLGESLNGLEDIAQVLDAGQASSKLGIKQPSAGFWYPRSGWLHPAAVCRVLLDHPNIQCREDCGEVTLLPVNGHWRATARGAVIGEAEVAIAAPGPAVTALSQFDWLPLQAIRGQITQLPTSDAFEGLRANLCHEGYIAPARAGYHSVGATFDIGDADRGPRIDDHRHNLNRLACALPACRKTLESLDPTTLRGRVGHRCASPDYLPVVGPAPDLPRFLADFGALRKNARQHITTSGSYLPGLYLSTAYGSRGLTYTPLAAELLASQICGEPLPLDRTLSRALAPARFIIRDLSRNRI